MSDRADFMNHTQKTKVKAFEEKHFGGKSAPRTHQNMIEATGVARPGKTAKDRAKFGR